MLQMLSVTVAVYELLPPLSEQESLAANCTPFIKLIHLLYSAFLSSMPYEMKRISILQCYAATPVIFLEYCLLFLFLFVCFHLNI